MHPLKPALVIGSGFHRHVLGATAAGGEALYDWHALVEAAASRMEVAPPPRDLPPTLRWDTLINSAIRDGYRDAKSRWYAPNAVPAHRAEGDARSAVARVLSEASTGCPANERARIPSRTDWGCVISLNFDVAWHPRPSARLSPLPEGATTSRLTRPELERLSRSVAPLAGAAPRVWFPNGSVLSPKTIRMGLYDYGNAPAAMQHAFRALKQWERVVLGGSTARGTEPFQLLAAALRHASELGHEVSQVPVPAKIPLTWVAEFLYRPLVLVGVGLSDQETGLWWLLAQRFRNMARLTGPVENSVHILVHAADRERAKFWATKPFGIEAVTCEDWADGWQRMLALRGA